MLRKSDAAKLRVTAVQQDMPFLQQFRDFRIVHLAVADDAVDVQHAGRLFPDVMLAAVALAGLYHVPAAQGAASDDSFFSFHDC